MVRELDVAVQEHGQAAAVGADQSERRGVVSRGQEAGDGAGRLAAGVGLARDGADGVEEGVHQVVVLIAGREGHRGEAGGSEDHTVAGDHPEAQVVEGGHGVHPPSRRPPRKRHRMKRTCMRLLAKRLTTIQVVTKATR